MLNGPPENKAFDPSNPSKNKILDKAKELDRLIDKVTSPIEKKSAEVKPIPPKK